MDFSKLEEYLDTIPKTQLPGIDFLVYHHGKKVYRYMSGTCDYRFKKPVSKDTLYWVYSMTKPITMTAVMQCVEKGLIWLEDYVGNYIPAFNYMKVKGEDGALHPAQNKIKVKHLLTMTSGLDYDLNHPAMLEAMRDPEVTTEKIVNAIAERPLLFEPGTAYKYSLSHDVAARVVEVATGKRFGEYLKENIFDPLGMNDSTFAETPAVRARLAAQFKRDEEQDRLTVQPFRNDYIFSKNYESGGAGLITSASDYGKFVAAMSTAFSSESPLLGRATMELLRKPALPDEMLDGAFSKFKQGYSYGLGVRTMKYPHKQNARSPIGEFGWDGAAGSIGMIDPDNEIALCYMVQVKGCQYSYFELFPKARDLVYEIIKGEA